MFVARPIGAPTRSCSAGGPTRSSPAPGEQRKEAGQRPALLVEVGDSNFPVLGSRGPVARCADDRIGLLSRENGASRRLRIVQAASRFESPLWPQCGPAVAPRPALVPLSIALSGAARDCTRRPQGHEELSLMPKDDVTVAGMSCWLTSPRRPAKSAAWSTKPVILTCQWNPVSARAATAWSAGPYCWRSCCPDPGAGQQEPDAPAALAGEVASGGRWRFGSHPHPVPAAIPRQAPCHAEPVIMVGCPRSTMTSSRPCGGCGPPSASSRSSRSSAMTRQRGRRDQVRWRGWRTRSG
jgi:hypothetical protein